MKLTNNQIYDYANKLLKSFKGDEVFPIKFNFYLQKNMKTIVTLAQEIDESRIEVGQRYGSYNEEVGSYDIKRENIDIAKQEYADLMNLEQDVQLYTLSISDLPDSMELSLDQMQAIEFMLTDKAAE